MRRALFPDCCLLPLLGSGSGAMPHQMGSASFDLDYQVDFGPLVQ
jgi:hypothetical protein